ncbi:CBO0543 family protein [Aquibacillus kalidii]|uniref:CBO0543 family protein n=1 Tax=Aquibacillus kalidii TaxID=2762597 RepID=UPI0016475E74|nr:CBO0543 family protein [Aquibacillus kalidii]
MSVKAMLFLIVILSSGLGCLFIIKLDWKRYGFIFLVSAVSGNLLCYFLTYIGFYTFPNNLLHNGLLIPYGLVSTVFPFIALFGIRYSPKKWVWKIPFYWGIIHLGVFAEVILKRTSIFRFEPEWDLWDSYTLWWINFLLLETLGGKVVPDSARNPISSDAFRYGGWAWIIFHLIVITTIFLAGIYVGVTVIK